MDDKVRKSKKSLIFVIVYCVLLLFFLIGIKLIEFKTNEHPLELRAYTDTVSVSQKLLININTADLHQLCQLPQIGEVIAQRIIDYRIENGSFNDINEITEVNGVGETTFNKIRDLITVD